LIGALIGAPLSEAPVIDQDATQAIGWITTATSAAGMTMSDFGTLRVENAVTGDVVFAKFEFRQDPTLVLESTYADGPNPHRIFELT